MNSIDTRTLERR